MSFATGLRWYLAGALGVKIFDYFGDLDPRGLRIGRDLSMLMSVHALTVVPAKQLYEELLNVPLAGKTKPVSAEAISLAWLPVELQNPVREHLSNHGRIAQEALGWEKLCVLYATDPDTDFNLGFTPSMPCREER